MEEGFHDEEYLLDPSSFHRHHIDCGVLPVPGGSRLDPERCAGEFHGEPAPAGAVARHRCPDVSLSVVFQRDHQCGLIVTLLGLAMLTMLFRDALDRTFSSLALIALLFGDVLMVI